MKKLLVFCFVCLLAFTGCGSKEKNKGNEVKYNVGEEVTLLDGSNWYVLEQNGDSITLFSTVNYGERTYFSNSINDYEQSIVKEKLEKEYLPTLKSSLSDKGGNVDDLKVRIISVDDIRKVLGIDDSIPTTDIEIDSSYSWLYGTGSYWTNTKLADDNSVYIVSDWTSFAIVSEDVASTGLTGGNKLYIRPVIEANISNIKLTN